jgi:MazG family protein
MWSRRVKVSEPREETRAEAFDRMLEIVDRLRAPDGCPWDRKQTIETMAPHLIEEAYELLEAVECGADHDMIEEAGDVLLVVAMICKIAEEAGRFDLGDASRAIVEKLVRRHPHVFGEEQITEADEVLGRWEAIKKAEREGKEEDSSALAGVPKALPALQRARRTCDKAATAGFAWEDAKGALAKLKEEVGELEAELQGVSGKADLGGDREARVIAELGDVLLAGAHLGRYLGIDPERACREAVRRFEGRFRKMEASLGEGGVTGRPLAELLDAWEQAKASD